MPVLFFCAMFTEVRKLDNAYEANTYRRVEANKYMSMKQICGKKTRIVQNIMNVIRGSS